MNQNPAEHFKNIFIKHLLLIPSLLFCITCFGSNPINKTYKTQALKNGYTLAFKRHDSINYACLIKDGKEVEISEDEADTTMPLEALGYLYADFPNCLVLATHHQTDPIKIEVIDKLTGLSLMHGASPFYQDTVNGIMLFEGMYSKQGKIILYDFNTGKYELYNAPRQTPCFCCFCWKLLTLTDSEIKIEYLDMNYQKAVKTYSRKTK